MSVIKKEDQRDLSDVILIIGLFVFMNGVDDETIDS